MELKRKGKCRHGFTMTEVLAVVAVVAVTLAIGVPAIIGSVRRSNLKKLDDSARSIFLAAQNSLTAMVGNGELEDFADGIASELSEDPSDFPGDGHGNLEDLRFLDSENSAHKEYLKKIVPGGSIDKELENGRYIVEYNRASGAVYAVWYSDEKEFIEDAGFAHKPREFDDRLKGDYPIGYYGGSGVDYALVGQMPIPELTVINAEELRLQVTMPSASFKGTDVKVDVVMEGLTSNATATLINGAVLAVTKTGEVVLDTLKSYPSSLPPTSSWEANPIGNSFKSWSADDGTFIPGEDIKLTVTTRYNGTDGEIYLPQTASVTTNSLFARVEEKDDPDTTVEEAIPTAMIAYGRHLQNLDSAISGVTADITAAEQVQAIDFGAGSEWNTTYETGGTVKYFKPINNANLKSYDGKSLPIRNLSVNETSANAGLFGKIEEDDKLENISNVLLVNASVKGYNAGSLVGNVQHSLTVENCGAYIDEPFDPATTPKVYVESISNSGDADAGGLIGNSPMSVVRTVTIRNSFAATVVKGWIDAGGLIGGAGGNGTFNIEHSYAACYLQAGTNPDSPQGGAGGLVGRKNRTSVVTIESSYAAGIIVSSKDEPGGFVSNNTTENGGGNNHTNTVKITNSYSAVRFSKALAEASRNSTIKIYGATYGLTSDSNVYYVRQAGVVYSDVATISKGLTTKQLSAMKSGTSTLTLGGDWYKPDPSPENPTYATFPYKQTKETADLTTPYPYPMLKDGDGTPMLHYGDWLEQEIFGYMLYWEKEDGTYHFYTRVPDGAGGTKPVHDLHTVHHLENNTNWSITEWGYALVGFDLELPTGLTTDSIADAANIEAALNNFVSGHTTDFADTALSDLLDEDDTLVFFDGQKRTTNGFFTIETDDGWLEFNLNFAAAVDIVESADEPTVPTHMGKELNTTTGDFPYQIRTVEQLDNIPDDNNNYFEQTYDLYEDGYSGYDGPSKFQGTYDGGSYRILELNITNGGLFRSLDRGTLKGIILYSPTGTATILPADGNSGGLAGTVENYNTTITDCVVAGYKLNGDYTGGLIGSVGYNYMSQELTITNCAAVNDLNSTEYGQAGGLVGHVNHGTISITDSYAGGNVTVGTYGYAGGIVGFVDGNGTLTYNRVYSYAKISGGFFVYGIGPSDAYASYANCSYWKDGISGNPQDATTAGVMPMTLKELKDAAAPAAQHTYRPGATSAAGLTDLHDTDNYPFAAKVTGPNGELVHYGEWPELVEAAFYWEKEKEDDPTTPGIIEYKYHFYTVGYLGGSLITGNDLCDIHHTETADHEIVAWGYGLYAKDIANMPTLSEGTPITDFTVYADDGGARDEWLKRYGDEYATPMTADNIRMYAYATEDKFVTAESRAKSGKIYELNLGFARAIDVTEILPGGAAPTVPTNMGKETTLANPAYTPYYIRTVRQLDNIKDDDSGCYKQSHDLYGAYNYNGPYTYTDYDGADYFSGQYDGKSYRILELSITARNLRQGGMFAVLRGATLKDIVMFSPSGRATITGNVSNSVGGLALSIQTNDLTTIDNCVVAGYTISTDATKALGGLVGVVDGGNLTINDSAAVNILDGINQNQEGIGGLVGSCRSGTLNITNSYAGGTIKGTYNNLEVGGIVGHRGTGTATYTNVYSYVNMSAVSPDEVYGIGPSGTYTNCYYWNVGTGGKSVLDDDGSTVLGVNFTGLTNCITSTPFGPVANTYRVKLTSGDYPFPAVVRDQDGALVHYGDWPVLEEAALYWEQENLTGGGSVYHVHLVGFLNGEQLIYDDLCTVYHPEYSGHEINNWGYATIDLTVTAGSPLGAFSDSGVTTKLEGMFGAIGTWNFYETNATSSKNVTLESTHGYGVYYVDPGFAAAIEWVDSGSGTMGTSSKPFQIRTIQQLDNIPDAHNAPGNATKDGFIPRYFRQSHDVYGDGYSTYIAPYYFAGEYDGDHYRILDLQLKTSDGYRYGLFGVLEANDSQSTTLKNIILFSPNGIEVNATGHSMGGLALAASNNHHNSQIYIDNCVVSGYTIKGNQSVGGLVGAANGTLTITNSAAVNKLETSSDSGVGIGGLVGEVRYDASVAITNSYAGGTIVTSGTTSAISVHVGGLVGNTTTNGGVTGSATYTNVYSYMNLTGVARDDVYAIGPGTYNDSNNYWFPGTGGKEVLDDTLTNDVTGVNYETLERNGTTSTVDENHTFATELNRLKTKEYPFSAVIRNEKAELVHYGDWPMVDEAVFYWELENGQYHYYFQGIVNGETLFFDNLCKEYNHNLEAQSWGYGFYWRFSSSPLDLSALGAVSSNGNVKNGLQALVGGLTDDYAKVYSSNDSNNFVINSNLANYRGTTYYHINPAFASAVVMNTDPTTSTLGTAGHPYQIRNVQQLDNIPNGTDVNTPETGVYSQTHDLNGTGYAGYSGSQYFGGTYNGNGYQIRELAINNTTGTDGQGGLFVNLCDNASLNGITLSSNSSAEIKDTGTHSIGGLAMGVYGNVEISQCSVTGYIISVENPNPLLSGNSVGGLVGFVDATGQLTIKDCSAVNTLKAPNRNVASGVGGLVGEVRTGGTVEITDSHAGGSIENADSADSVGGIVGNVDATGSSATYTRVYSYVNMSGVAATSVYGIGPTGSAGTYDTCYFWGGGLAGKFPNDSGASNVTVLWSSAEFPPEFGVTIDEVVYPNPNTLTCSCTSKCASGSTDSICEKCKRYPWLCESTGDPGVSEGPGIVDEYYCTCTGKCTDDAINNDCPLCSWNHGECNPGANSGSGTDAPTDPTDPTEGDPTEPTDPTDPTEPTEGDPTEATEGSNEPDLTGGVQMPQAALPPDPPEEVPDPTPSEPDPGTGGKEEEPE